MTHRSEGQFHPKAWMQEGWQLYASAKSSRANWILKRKKILRRTGNHHLRHLDMSALEGLAKSSFLLLGYSLEMFLKAGLAKLYAGCSEELFQEDIRKVFSHRYAIAADALAFPTATTDHADFDLLSRAVLADARYPVAPGTGTLAHLENERRNLMWNRANFFRLRQLVLRVRKFVEKVDSDRTNMANVTRIAMDIDGYLTCRTGGNLPHRITYRFSTAQRSLKEDDLDLLRAQIEGDPTFVRIRLAWPSAVLHEDKIKPR
ncbi:hypothetical protein [Roseateles noduli]|uniref:hypothetical protein n=1 Tax=Roseateles noduli TaxID=2052484 RepID=UPI003D647C70